jgi:hypothetical protein
MITVNHWHAHRPHAGSEQQQLMRQKVHRHKEECPGVGDGLQRAMVKASLSAERPQQGRGIARVQLGHSLYFKHGWAVPNSCTPSTAHTGCPVSRWLEAQMHATCCPCIRQAPG